MCVSASQPPRFFAAQPRRLAATGQPPPAPPLAGLRHTAPHAPRDARPRADFFIGVGAIILLVVDQHDAVSLDEIDPSLPLIDA